jgi:N-acetylmuramoyl-L-alanine amidase
LTRAGFKVSLTRNTDTYIELPQRPELAKRRNADLFLSLHFNAFPQNTVRGTEVYCLTPSGAPSSNAQGETAGSGWSIGNRNNPKNISLAYQVQKSLTRNLSVEDRGLRRARFWVLRDAAMPAILIEAGFMTHPSEGRKIFDPAYRRQIARAIVEGVLAYKKISEPTA